MIRKVYNLLILLVLLFVNKIIGFFFYKNPKLLMTVQVTQRRQ